MTAPQASTLDPGDRISFERDGYIVKRNFLTAGQIDALIRTLAADEAFRRCTVARGDGAGGAAELSIWNDPGDDSFGAAARSASIVGAVTGLLGDEVYHYHSKLSVKRPGSSGEWVWHQDYGYWYGNGCLRPELLTVAIPLTPMSQANGCLQLLTGSQRCGRLDHGKIGDQHGADTARVTEIERTCERTAFEAEPGDVLFFDCNVLHRSAGNGSDRERELFLIAYNTRRNEPAFPHHHAAYTPIDVLADREIEARGGVVMGERRRFVRRPTTSTNAAA